MKKAALALLLLMPVAFADLVGPPTPASLSIVVPILINLALNFILLYAILRWGFAYRKTGKIVDGALIGTAGGFIIDYVAYFAALMLSLMLMHEPILPRSMSTLSGLLPITYLVISAMLLFAFYFYIATKHLHLPDRRALQVGIAMALLTNPVIGLMLFGY